MFKPFRPYCPPRVKTVVVKPSIRVQGGKAQLVKAHLRSRPTRNPWCKG
jgi:hypothetical protein